MRHFQTFSRLSAGERGALAAATLLLVGIKIGLQVLPFQTLRRLLGRISDRRNPGCLSTKQITWAVLVASRYLPGSMNCLIQALTAQVLLQRAGFSAELHIGLVKDQDGQMEGHAWIESQGQIVIGALEDLPRYIPLPPLLQE